MEERKIFTVGSEKLKDFLKTQPDLSNGYVGDTDSLHYYLKNKEIQTELVRTNLKQNGYKEVPVVVFIDYLKEVIDKKITKPTDKYKYCNHHHELTDQHEIVNFADGEFVANKKAIPLLKALNELGLRTRSHHIADDSQYGWFTILLDNVEIAIVDVNEADADRTKYNGKKELRLTFKSK